MSTRYKTLVSEYGHPDELTDKTDWFVEKVMEKDKELAEKFIAKTDLVLNPHFTKDTGEMVVKRFENKDGSTGEHWNYSQTTSVLNSKGYDFDEGDWYVALNMVWSDYFKNGRSDDVYIELASDFLSDPDAPDDKMKKYWKALCY